MSDSSLMGITIMNITDFNITELNADTKDRSVTASEHFTGGADGGKRNGNAVRKPEDNQGQAVVQAARL